MSGSDEFAWVRITADAMGSGDPVHHGNGRTRDGNSRHQVRPGSFVFGEIATTTEQHDHWSRQDLTIEDAISQGMPWHGGLDEVAHLVRSES